MENKKGSQLSSNGIEADASQESNSLDVKENNREGYDFIWSIELLKPETRLQYFDAHKFGSLYLRNRK